MSLRPLLHELLTSCLMDGRITVNGARAIRAEAEAPAVDWKPIETAPQDGTRVLLWNTEGGGYAITGAWRADSAQDHESYTHWAPLPAGPEVA